jgi:hypothetical protein
MRSPIRSVTREIASNRNPAGFNATRDDLAGAGQGAALELIIFFVIFFVALALHDERAVAAG